MELSERQKSIVKELNNKRIDTKDILFELLNDTQKQVYEYYINKYKIEEIAKIMNMDVDKVTDIVQFDKGIHWAINEQIKKDQPVEVSNKEEKKKTKKSKSEVKEIIKNYKKIYNEGKVSKKNSQKNLPKLIKMISYTGNSINDRLFLAIVYADLYNSLEAERIINDCASDASNDFEQTSIENTRKEVIKIINSLYVKKLHDAGYSISQIIEQAEKLSPTYRKKLNIKIIRDIYNKCEEHEKKQCKDIEDR